SLLPGSSIVWEVVMGEGRGFCAVSGAFAWPLASFCCAGFAARPGASSGAGASSATMGKVEAKKKQARRTGARIHFRKWASEFIDRGSASTWFNLTSHDISCLRGGNFADARRALGLPLPHRGQGVHYPFGWENHDNFGPFTEFGFQCEGSAVELDQTLYDRQTEARAFHGVLLCQRSAAE